MKKINLNEQKKSFMKLMFSEKDFLMLQTDIIFKCECVNVYKLECNKLKIELVNRMVVNEYLRKKISDSMILITFNNGLSSAIPTTRIENLSYEDFLNFLCNLAPSNFVKNFHLENWKQQTLGDFGL